jgi:hypothetical protein
VPSAGFFPPRSNAHMLLFFTIINGLFFAILNGLARKAHSCKQFSRRDRGASAHDARQRR